MCDMGFVQGVPGECAGGEEGCPVVCDDWKSGPTLVRYGADWKQGGPRLVRDWMGRKGDDEKRNETTTSETTRVTSETSDTREMRRF